MGFTVSDLLGMAAKANVEVSFEHGDTKTGLKYDVAVGDKDIFLSEKVESKDHRLEDRK